MLVIVDDAKCGKEDESGWPLTFHFCLVSAGGSGPDLAGLAMWSFSVCDLVLTHI